jgi:hypothetical protein
MAQKLQFVDEAATITGTRTYSAAVTVNAALAHGSGNTLGFYGATPAAIRAANSTLHYASFLSLSSNATIASNVAAFAAEVAATLVGLGIWA